MGYSMARNLHHADLLAAVWNRTPAVAAKFSQQTGVQHLTQLAAMPPHCQAIVICVSADDDLLSVMADILPTLAPNTLIIDCSTVSAQTARQAAAQVTQAGGQFLDAPVSGGTEGAKHGTLAIMVGGEPDAFARATPIFTAIGQRAEHVGAVGAGQATKAVNQIMAAGINQAVTEALAFGQAQGLPMEKVVDIVSGGAAGNWFLNHRGKTMLAGEFPPGFKLALHHKDLKICQQMAQASGAAIPLVDKTVADYEQLIAQYGDEDISALFRLKTR